MNSIQLHLLTMMQFGSACQLINAVTGKYRLQYNLQNTVVMSKIITISPVKATLKQIREQLNSFQIGEIQIFNQTAFIQFEQFNGEVTQLLAMMYGDELIIEDWNATITIPDEDLTWETIRQNFLFKKTPTIESIDIAKSTYVPSSVENQIIQSPKREQKPTKTVLEPIVEPIKVEAKIQSKQPYIEPIKVEVKTQSKQPQVELQKQEVLIKPEPELGSVEEIRPLSPTKESPKKIEIEQFVEIKQTLSQSNTEKVVINTKESTPIIKIPQPIEIKKNIQQPKNIQPIQPIQPIVVPIPPKPQEVLKEAQKPILNVEVTSLPNKVTIPVIQQKIPQISKSIDKKAKLTVEQMQLPGPKYTILKIRKLPTGVKDNQVKALLRDFEVRRIQIKGSVAYLEIILNELFEMAFQDQRIPQWNTSFQKCTFQNWTEIQNLPDAYDVSEAINLVDSHTNLDVDSIHSPIQPSTQLTREQSFQFNNLGYQSLKKTNSFSLQESMDLSKPVYFKRDQNVTLKQEPVLIEPIRIEPIKIEPVVIKTEPKKIVPTKTEQVVYPKFEQNLVKPSYPKQAVISERQPLPAWIWTVLLAGFAIYMLF